MFSLVIQSAIEWHLISAHSSIDLTDKGGEAQWVDLELEFDIELVYLYSCCWHIWQLLHSILSFYMYKMLNLNFDFEYFS